MQSHTPEELGSNDFDCNIDFDFDVEAALSNLQSEIGTNELPSETALPNSSSKTSANHLSDENWSAAAVKTDSTGITTNSTLTAVPSLNVDQILPTNGTESLVYNDMTLWPFNVQQNEGQGNNPTQNPSIGWQHLDFQEIDTQQDPFQKAFSSQRNVNTRQSATIAQNDDLFVNDSDNFPFDFTSDLYQYSLQSGTQQSYNDPTQSTYVAPYYNVSSLPPLQDSLLAQPINLHSSRGPTMLARRRSTTFPKEHQQEHVYNIESESELESSSPPVDHGKRKISHRFSRFKKSKTKDDFLDLVPEKPQRPDKHPWVRINAGTKGLTLRSAKSNHYDSKIDGGYEDTEHPLGTWSYDGTFFDYSKEGELKRHCFSVTEVERFIWGHKGQLTMWIQTAPSDAQRRVPTHHSTECRFEDCPARKYYSGKINVGHLQIAWDDQWSAYGNRRDPHHVAGFAHLYCMERFLDFPSICKSCDVRVDDRYFGNEPTGRFSGKLNRSTAIDVAARFLKSCKKGNFQSDYPKYPPHLPSAKGLPKDHEHTLTCRMTEVRVQRMSRGKAAQFEARGSKPSHLHVNMGDLEFAIISRKKQTERKKAILKGHILPDETDLSLEPSMPHNMQQPKKKQIHVIEDDEDGRPSPQRSNKRLRNQIEGSEEDSEYEDKTASKRIKSSQHGAIRRSNRFQTSHQESTVQKNLANEPSFNNPAAVVAPLASRDQARKPRLVPYSDDDSDLDGVENLEDFDDLFESRSPGLRLGS